MPNKPKNKLIVLFILLFYNIFLLKAQDLVPINGLHSSDNQTITILNADIYIDYKTCIKQGGLKIKNKKILEVGKEVKALKGEIIIDAKGAVIYPSFIDLYASNTKNIPAYKSNGKDTRFFSDKSGSYYWNSAIHPEINASEFLSDFDNIKLYKECGFGNLVIHIPDGIVRGTGCLITTTEKSASAFLISAQTATFYSFNKGSSKQAYPSSLMGSIALMRQYFSDINWYANAKDVEQNLSLNSEINTKNLPKIFDAGSKQNMVRAIQLNPNFIIKGTGEEYQILDQIRARKPKLIIPLKLPDALNIENDLDYTNANLNTMRHWKTAPYNAKILSDSAYTFAFTLNGISNFNEFKTSIQKLLGTGLTSTQILKALTYTPAQFINNSKIGNLYQGSHAQFIICNKPINDSNFNIIEHWEIDQMYSSKLESYLEDGMYQIDLENKSSFTLKVSHGNSKHNILNYKNASIIPSIDAAVFSYKIKIGQDTLINCSYLANQTWKINAFINKTKYAGILKQIKKDTNNYRIKLNKDTITLKKIPFTYNLSQKAYLLKNATIWPCDIDTIYQNYDIEIINGKISRLGKNLKCGSCETIDASNMHITPGLIDEHSHIAIHGGVNEGTQSVTSEVSIQDVVNSEDINIYRQLAGGVTTSHLLHGSANCIGGQTALIKLKYGQNESQLQYKNHKFIKFALGENVKQSNWGDYNTVRYPQTRMGVEQLMKDAFLNAKYYEKQKSENSRIDYEKEVLLEILHGKRHITCHSYVQSEILMLIHLADSLGFKVNTFTHILEGYKVADALKKHGAAASTFSDWWAYKMEVAEAIPYNASILNDYGILTGINSDDAEMARRLNQEAAKTIKYGNTKPTDALKLVTINPAKMLKIDQQTGSITVGKDADLVIWTQNPLSLNAQVKTTFIEGKIYFDQKINTITLSELETEKRLLAEQMKKAQQSGEKTHKPEHKKQKLYHCDDIEEETN